MISTVGKHGVVINIFVVPEASVLMRPSANSLLYSNAYDFAYKLLGHYLLSFFLLSTLGDAYLSDQEGFLFSAKAAIPEDASVRSGY